MLDRIRKLFNAGEPSERVEIPSAEKVEAETQKEHTGSVAETPEETAPMASGEYELDQTAQQEETEEPELAPVAGNAASEYSLDEEGEAQAPPIPRRLMQRQHRLLPMKKHTWKMNSSRRRKMILTS